MDTYELKIISGNEKCFMDEKIGDKKEIKKFSMFSNERLSFQLAYSADTSLYRRNAVKFKLKIESELKDDISVCTVEQVPVRMPIYSECKDEWYLRKTPGLYPDLLLPMNENDNLIFVKDELRSLFVQIENKNGIKPGKYEIFFSVMNEEEKIAQTSVEIDIKEEKLPELDIYHTEWFYTDCIAQYYDCEVWSERHWELIENYMRAAVDLGVNLLLTPVFTPPLDTLVGGERLTTQLVDVYLENGKYTFGYERFDRWVKLCKKVGIKYFEISHFFTQWGAKHSPKVIAKTKDGEKKIFGWETEASGEEYSAFLHAFLDDFIPHVKKLGIDKDCLYHISDEPKIDDLENYTKARNVVGEQLKDYMIIDALSNYEFYKTGAIRRPIPANNHIDDFLQNNVPDLWVYYCCSQFDDVSNRFMAMPGERTRIIGTQIYKYDIKGFLHWGFNFYNTRYSVKPLNPFNDVNGEYFTPAGDCFLVYPTQDGKTYSSLHAENFYMALQDYRALKACEKKLGKEKTVELMEGVAGQEITFTNCPHDKDFLYRLREKINGLF